MEEKLSINEKYAARYNEWRAKEEMQKFKDKHGNIENEEDLDSSSSETEDEDGELLTPNLEKSWLRALAAVKSQNPKIYNEGTRYFAEADSDDSQGTTDKKEDSTRKKSKPMFLKDYDREVILKKGGVIESDESGNESEEEMKEKQRLAANRGYYEEQKDIKESFKSALEDSDSESDDQNLLSKRTKLKEEEEREEAEYLEWLKGQKDEISDDREIGIELNPLKEYWNDPKIDENEKFLRDYILNKRYKDDEEEEVPTYDDVVAGGLEEFSEEEDILEKQEHFERKYNFRYEEPDEEFVKSYPRTIGESLRQKDNKRAKKRAEIKERKLLEKNKKKEELKQLKNMKRKEIMGKLDTLKEITGNPSVGFTEEDINEDFDPQKYDEMMKKVFDEQYYDQEEDADGKPIFPDDLNDDDDNYGEEENWDNWQGWSGEAQEAKEEHNEPHCEDPDFNMDADYDPNQPAAEDRSYGLDGKSKKKRKSKFKQALEKKKPVFNPEDKTFEEYFDEYYKLDYEDIIGDLPCRFKYRRVMPNDFGLSTEEVIGAKEKELNSWVSVKKMSQYRTEEEEHYDMRIYKKKARNPNIKSRILNSLATEEEKAAESESDDQQPSTSGNHASAEQAVTKKDAKSKGEKVSEAHSSESSQTSPKGSGASKKRAADSSVSEKGFKKMKIELETSMPSHTASKQDLKKKRKKKKNRKPTSVVQTRPNVPQAPKQGPSKNKKKSRRGPVMSEERLKAYGIDPKKFKYTHGKNKQHT